MSDGRRQRREPGPPRKHRAVHLDDPTYAQGRALAARAGLSFSSWVAAAIKLAYQSTSVPSSEEE